ncbi:hypothetical protein MTR67_006748 [Solanum verrucosum]|uniref:CBS domain-containing protein n=1 Tax=Solanum verrucosum TaxID=315347 RepID=A0AAF0PYF2_SOLVR|nr:hypothetical protein MTR67_006748 [Solanum verrucosum]
MEDWYLSLVGSLSFINAVLDALNIHVISIPHSLTCSPKIGQTQKVLLLARFSFCQMENLITKSLTNYGRFLSILEAYIGQCLAGLLTLFQAGKRLGLGQEIEVTRGSSQLAYGGLSGKKGIPDVLRIEVVAYTRSNQTVGMAATLAGVCQVPLTAVLLLFELTQDYRIVLPLLGAVGMSSWVTSGQTSKGVVQDRKKLKDARAQMTQWQGTSSSNIGLPSLTYSSGVEPSQKESNLCKLESSLCLYESDDEENDFARKVLVAQAMRTQYVTVLMSTLLMETISLMLAEKQSCAIIVDENNFLIGLLTLGDIQNYSKWPRAEGKCHEVAS